MKRTTVSAPLRADAGTVPESRGWSLAAVFGLLVVVTFAAYFPALNGELLWDDAGHVTRSDLQSWTGLGRIWFEVGATQQYYPLLHSAFWIEHRFWGDAAIGYHLVNLVWHATAGCLLVALLRRLAIPGAVLAAFFFALHPVAVESVAWIAEQKNTLSTVFYLAAALAWLRFEDERRPARYAVATLWFVAALVTKTVTASLPAALLVIAWWRRGRLSWRADVLALLPWFGVGAVAGLFTAWIERTSIGAQGADFNLSLVERGLLAGRIFWFYLGKLIWPADLAFFYPRWHVDARAGWQYLFPLAAIGLAGGLLWWIRSGRGRALPAAVLLYGGILFPVLGFVNVYPFIFSYVADHFQYLASLSFFAVVAAGFAKAGETGTLRLHGKAVRVLGVAIVALLGALTWQQSKQYVDSVTLYRTTLARNPDSWVAHHNLAMELASRGAPEEALPHARRALELKPDYPEALNNLADDLTRTGHAVEALPLLERALQLQPRYAQAENNLGIALTALGRTEEGIRHFHRAIELQPPLAEAHYNLGLAEAERGAFAAAIPQFAETIRLRPDHADAELKWGVALALTDRLPEARAHFERAMSLDPESPTFHYTYGRVLLNARELEEALRQFREALRLDPALPGLQADLAFVLQRLGRTDEALQHAREASRQR